MSALRDSHSDAEPIFPPWHFARWKAVDDRVRGGSSTSHLDPISVPLPHSPALPSGVEVDEKGHVRAARFWGHLDIDTLGGAGFASQRFTFAPSPLHLPALSYTGIRLHLLPDPTPSSTASSSRAETFTLVLKTTLPIASPPDHPKVPPNPEPASLSYEATFTPFSSPSSSSSAGKAAEVYFEWEDFTPTYRGREVPRDDPKYQPLHSEKIYEMSLMCRSGFGGQKGDFGVVLLGVEGWKKQGNHRWGEWMWSWVGWIKSWFIGDAAAIRLPADDDEPRPKV